jgi:hypothetical protein
LHINEGTIAATTAGVRAEHFARSGACTELQSLALVLVGRQQHIKLSANNFGLAMLEEIFEGGIAHANAAIQVEDHHGFGMAREQKLEIQLGWKGIVAIQRRVGMSRFRWPLAYAGVGRAISILWQRGGLVGHVLWLGTKFSLPRIPPYLV